MEISITNVSGFLKLLTAHNLLLMIFLVGKESTCSAEDTGLVPELGRSIGGRCGNPVRYSCPENPMDIGAWQTTVHRVAKRWKKLK